MAKSRRSRATRTADDTPKERIAAPEHRAEPETGTPTDESALKAPAPTEAPQAPKAGARSPGRAITPGPQTIGARRFFGARLGQDPICRAFVATDKAEHGNRNLTREQWVEAFQRFVAAPR